jgi:hypothetical protein
MAYKIKQKKIQVRELTGIDFLPLYRVPYGKEDTPKELREYKVEGLTDCPVGTLKEWEIYARKVKKKGLRFKEKDGSVGFRIFEEK